MPGKHRVVAPLPQDRKTFGLKVRQLRREWNVPQGELADAMGASKTWIQAVERAELMPSLDKAYILSRVLGVPLNILCEDFDIEVREPKPAKRRLAPDLLEHPRKNMLPR